MGASSSVGQSWRLITAWSRVQVLAGPPYSSYSNPILYEKGFGYVFCLQQILRKEKAPLKEYNKDFDIDFSPMSDETMSWLDELLMTCKRFHVDYYNASEKDRAFVEAVARKNYGLKQARNSGKPASTVAPFFGIHRAG